jgi:protein associated with RNAse G/E
MISRRWFPFKACTHCFSLPRVEYTSCRLIHINLNILTVFCANNSYINNIAIIIQKQFKLYCDCSLAYLINTTKLLYSLTQLHVPTFQGDHQVNITIFKKNTKIAHVKNDIAFLQIVSYFHAVLKAYAGNLYLTYFQNCRKI